MKYIFERNWVFVGLESQAPNPNDYFTTWVGRQPIIVARDKQGTLGAFINSCSHKGARIAHHRDGNAKQWVCSYHGWAYDTAGACIYIKDQDAGAPEFKELRAKGENHPIEATGKALRAHFAWQSGDDDYTEGTAAR